MADGIVWDDDIKWDDAPKALPQLPASKVVQTPKSTIGPVNLGTTREYIDPHSLAGRVRALGSSVPGLDYLTAGARWAEDRLAGVDSPMSWQGALDSERAQNRASEQANPDSALASDALMAARLPLSKAKGLVGALARAAGIGGFTAGREVTRGEDLGTAATRGGVAAGLGLGGEAGLSTAKAVFRGAGSAAPRLALKAVEPAPSEVAILRDQIGPPPEQGRALMDLRTSEGKPVLGALTTPEQRLSRVQDTLDTAGPLKGAMVDHAPEGFDFNRTLSRVQDVVDAVNSPEERTVAGLDNIRDARGLLRRFRSNYEPKVVGTARDVQGAMANQGGTSAVSEPPTPSTVNGEVVPLEQRGPQATVSSSAQGDVPLAQSQMDQGANAATRADRAAWDVSQRLRAYMRAHPDYTMTAEGRDLLKEWDAATAEAARAAQAAEDAGTSFENIHNASPNGSIRDPSLRRGRLGQDTARPQPDSGAVPVFDKEPMTIQQADALRGRLADDVWTTASEINRDRPDEAIAKSPELKLKRDVARILKEEIESVFDQKAPGAAGPVAPEGARFRGLKGAYEAAAALKPVIENSANRAAGSHNLSPAHFLRTYAAPVASRLMEGLSGLEAPLNKLDPTVAAKLAALKEMR